MEKRKNKIFTAEQEKYIIDNIDGTTTKEMAYLLNLKFGINVTWKQIRYFKQNRKIKSNIDTRFKKGSEIGKDFRFKKGKHHNITQEFKKGRIPHNKKDIGDEIEKPNGRIWVKIDNPDIWKPKHHIIWEKHNGKLKKGQIIIFKDGDIKNIKIENLMVITRKELAVLNKQKLLSSNREITEVAVIMARLMIKRYEIEQRRKK